MDWLHCNRCYVTPSRGGGDQQQYWFTACGHILCGNCLGSVNGARGLNKICCIVCRKTTQLTEINSGMKPEVLAYFRHPKQLVEEYATRLRKVMEFQRYQMKHLWQEKAAKMVENARAEAQRCAEKERMTSAECDNTKKELERSKEKERQLKAMIAERDKERNNRLHKMHHHNKISSPAIRHRVFPSLNGNTPLNMLSFIGCPTSTPIGAAYHGNTAFGGDCTSSNNDLSAPPQNDLQQMLTPQLSASIVAEQAVMPGTPVFRGYDQNSSIRSNVTPRTYF